MIVSVGGEGREMGEGGGSICNMWVIVKAFVWVVILQMSMTSLQITN